MIRRFNPFQPITTRDEAMAAASLGAGIADLLICAFAAGLIVLFAALLFAVVQNATDIRFVQFSGVIMVASLASSAAIIARLVSARRRLLGGDPEWGSRTIAIWYLVSGLLLLSAVYFAPMHKLVAVGVLALLLVLSLPLIVMVRGAIRLHALNPNEPVRQAAPFEAWQQLDTEAQINNARRSVLYLGATLFIALVFLLGKRTALLDAPFSEPPGPATQLYLAAIFAMPAVTYIVYRRSSWWSILLLSLAAGFLIVMLYKETVLSFGPDAHPGLTVLPFHLMFSLPVACLILTLRLSWTLWRYQRADAPPPLNPPPRP
jgi:hypothetical protein